MFYSTEGWILPLVMTLCVAFFRFNLGMPRTVSDISQTTTYVYFRIIPVWVVDGVRRILQSVANQIQCLDEVLWLPGVD